MCVINFVYTLTLPHLCYCAEVWAITSQANLTRILRIQKKDIRLLSHSHTKPLLFNLKILDIFDIWKYHIAVFMYLCRNELLPYALLKHFNLNSRFHNYETRHSDNYHLPQIQTTLMKKLISFDGPKV